MRAVIYCRVSSAEQVKNLSLESQERLCREYCAREGLEVDRVFVDAGVSAKSTERPEFLAMLAYCGRGKPKIDVVVVYALTRFARNTLNHHAVRNLLAGKGVSLRSVTETLDETPTGKFVETVLAAMAQLDNDVRAERTVIGMKEALARGRWTWAPPLGYVSTRNRFEPSLRRDQVSGPLISKAFELYNEGTRTKTETLRLVTALVRLC